MTLSIRFLSIYILLFILTSGKCGKIKILDSTYWIGSLIKDTSKPMPNGLSYSTNETLVFIGNQTRRYLNTDSDQFNDNFEQKTMQIKDKSVMDSLGNKLEYYGPNLILHKNMDSKKSKSQKIPTENNVRFYELGVNKKNNLVFIIGVNRKNGVGFLYAINTNTPKTVDDKIILEKVTGLGNTNRALSVNEATGDIAILKSVTSGGWKVILLSTDKLRILVHDIEEGEVDISQDVEKIYAGEEKKVREKIIKMADGALKMCNTESKSIRNLEKENQLLRNTLKTMQRRRDYILKMSNNFNYYKIHDKNTRIKYETKHEYNFENMVNETRDTMLKLINEKFVRWSDKSGCDSMFPTIKRPKSCGILKRDPLVSQELPWAIQILHAREVEHIRRGVLYEYICYGALIHPNIILSKGGECRLDIEQMKNGKYISRSGKYVESLLKRSLPDIERNITKTLNEFHKDFNNIKLLVLDMPYEVERVICFPLQQIFFNTGQCYGIYDKYTEIMGNKHQVAKLDPSSLIKCHKDYFDPSDGYFCRRGSKTCGDNYDLIFCPLMDNPETYALTSVHYMTEGCEEISLDVFRLTDIIERAFSEANYSLTSYYA